MTDSFAQFPDSASVWAYALDRELTSDEVSNVTDILSRFLTSWQSHSAPVVGTFRLLENRFILLGGYTTDGVSGCSTDSSVRVIKEIEQALDVNAFDRSLVFFRNGGGKVVAVKRPDFQQMVNSGHVTPTTVVFDTTIHAIGDLRDGKFETTFDNSWHSRAFKRSSLESP
jgi:hypothetical protein